MWRVFFVSALMVALCGTDYAIADTVPPAAPGDFSNTYVRMSEAEIRYVSVRQLVSAKCISCHRTAGSASDFTALLGSEDAWVKAALVVRSQPQNSVLFKYLIGSGFSPAPLGSMPLGGTFSGSELELVRNWIQQMPDPSQATPTPTPNPTIPPGGGKGRVYLPSQIVPRLGASLFVKSVLDDVFGSAAAAITETLVRQKISVFGGYCDQMGGPPSSTQGGGDTCSNVDVSIFSASIIPPSNAPRGGQTMKVCSALVFNDTALQYAISAATGKSDLAYLGSNPIPTSNEISAAYDLFSPGGLAPASAIVDSLVTLAQATRNKSYPNCPSINKSCQLDPWRYVFLTLCYDPRWQVL